MWQATGDRTHPAGSDKPIDVDVFPGTVDDYAPGMNAEPTSEPQPTTDEHTEPFDGVDL